MKYHVNENCIGCGLCESLCPEIFSMTDEGTAKAREGQVTDEEDVMAEEAKNNCPADAIEKVD